MEQIKENGTLSVEFTPRTARRVRIACALLGQSKSQFIRDSVEERLDRLDLPELKLLEGVGHHEHQAAA
jgi:hypothetical protein